MAHTATHSHQNL